MMNTSRRAALSQVLHWGPFTLGALGVLVYVSRGEWAFNLAHGLVLGLLGVLFLVGAGLWRTALVVLFLQSPQIWHFSQALPQAEFRLTQTLSEEHSTPYLRVEGTLRERWKLEDPDTLPLRTAAEHPETEGQSAALPENTTEEDPPETPLPVRRNTQGTVRVLLGEARVWLGEQIFSLAELEVEVSAQSTWPFRSRRRVRIGGVLTEVQRNEERLRLRLSGTSFHFREPPVTPDSGEGWRIRLRDRAAYYLSKPALAVYLPVVLGMSDRLDPEAREVAGVFRRVGISHLFAISGLHVGLIYGLFLLLLRLPGVVVSPAQGWVRGPTARRMLATAMVWAYIALIGFPVPAVRAALMGTLLVWGGLWGTRTSSLLVLSLAALLMLADHPTLLHDISFQLSFLSYLLLSASMRLRPDWHWGVLHPRVQSRVLAGAMGVVRGAMLNLWVTFIILIGLTPLISAVFGQVSFLVFLGNLLMVPLMALVILPLGLLVLSASLWALGTPVEGVFERLIFSVADPVLRLWVRLAEILDALGAPLVRDYRLIWTPGQFFLYYLLLGIALIGMGRLSRRNTVHFKAPH